MRSTGKYLLDLSLFQQKLTGTSFRPFSIQTIMKAKLAEDGREATTQRRMMMENGHPGVEVDEAAMRRGEDLYNKYYQQQGEQQLPSDAQVCRSSPILQYPANR